MLEDFKYKILKRDQSRKHEVKNSWGVYDAYKYYRKIRPKESKYVLKDVQFFSIVRKINNYLQDNIARGEDIVFPQRMGRLEIRKSDKTFNIKDGKVTNYLPIDWNSTLELWGTDEECFKNKTLVKYNNKELYIIHYNRSKAEYTNKSFYVFKPNRELKIKLHKNIEEGNIDAFMLSYG